MISNNIQEKLSLNNQKANQEQSEKALIEREWEGVGSGAPYPQPQSFRAKK